MKRILIILSVAFALFFLGCSTATEYTSVEGDERAAVIASVDPIAQRILDGIENKDFALFSKDFDEQMQKSLSQDQFDQLVKSVGSHGAVVSSEITAVETAGDYYRIIYKVTFEKAINLMTIFIPKDGLALVSGLWFK